jgi:TolA-binding protein
MAYGIIQIFLGLKVAQKPQAQVEKEDELESEFEAAVLMEAKSNIAQARAVYEKLARDYPETKVGRNARNTIGSMKPDMKQTSST